MGRAPALESGGPGSKSMSSTEALTQAIEDANSLDTVSEIINKRVPCLQSLCEVKDIFMKQ